MTALALRTLGNAMLRWQAATPPWPYTTERIHICIITTRSVAGKKAAGLTDANPALRGVRALKRLCAHFSQRDMPRRVLSYSNIKNDTEPRTNNANVVISTSFVLRS